RRRPDVRRWAAAGPARCPRPRCRRGCSAWLPWSVPAGTGCRPDGARPPRRRPHRHRPYRESALAPRCRRVGPCPSRTTARRARRLTAALLGLGLAAGLPPCSSAPSPDKTLNTSLAAWSKADFTGLTLLSDDGQPLAADAAKPQLTTLEGDLAGRTPTLKLAGKPKVNKDVATVPVSVTWPVANKVDWTYQTTVQAKLQKDKWVPYFGPTTFHPDLKSGDKITIKKSDAGRGQILDGTGQPIVPNQP